MLNKLGGNVYKSALMTLFFFFISISLTLLIRIEFGLSSVLASSIIGLLAWSLPFSSFDIKAIFYCGSFIGMTALSQLDGVTSILVTSFIGTIYFLTLGPKINGLGGKLGTIAFSSTLTFFVLGKVWIF